MCTVTWLREGSEIQLFANRDERHRRAIAEPPRLHRHGPIPYLAPVDGDFGGTWVSVNDRGLVLCLLNRYLEEKGQARENYVSRGLLVRDLAVEESPDSVARELKSRDLAPYRPFNLLVARPSEDPLLWIWTGQRLHAEPAVMPLVSSPRAAEVFAIRKGVLERLRSTWTQSDSDLLLALHRSHEPVKGPASVCMHHELAKTVSLTRVRIDDQRVVVDYFAGSPCEIRLPERIEMMRAGQDPS